MVGRVLQEAVAAGLTKGREIEIVKSVPEQKEGEARLDEQERREVEERLRDLGYQ